MKWYQRNFRDWVLDIVGLANQGIAVPVLQTTLIFLLLNILCPSLRASLDLSFLSSFLVNFILVDYIYYWNHRMLHSDFFWHVHSVHHDARIVDVLVSSRNTLWTPALIVYLWANGLFLFLLKDQSGFLAGIAMTSALDLWRHSRWSFAPGSRLHLLLSQVMITPVEHHWHHSRSTYNCNFGANFSLWDRWHGTFRQEVSWPNKYGVDRELGLFRSLIFPISRPFVRGEIK